jgi:TetR/AcrR family transcriptional regulator, fatty acid metabolism regulator protein
LSKIEELNPRATSIIEAAMSVFGEKGYHDSTISDIARAAGVSEATIYEYFEGKEDLLFTIPYKEIKETIAFLETMMRYIKGAENRLRAVIYCYFYAYNDNPNYSSLILLDIKHNRKFMKTDAYKMVSLIANIMLDCIREGISNGDFKPDLDPYLVRHIILGTMEHIFFRWHLRGRKDEMVDFVEPLLEIIFDGIRIDTD